MFEVSHGKDFGTYSTDKRSSPDFCTSFGFAVEAGECYPGIAICGMGMVSNSDP